LICGVHGSAGKKRGKNVLVVLDTFDPSLLVLVLFFLRNTFWSSFHTAAGGRHMHGEPVIFCAGLSCVSLQDNKSRVRSTCAIMATMLRPLLEWIRTNGLLLMKEKNSV
jgi:hypothetical protein